MFTSEQKVAMTSGASSAIICKIQNMPWLKRDITASTNAKLDEKTKGKMLPTVPDTEKDEQSAGEKKDKRKQKRSRKPNQSKAEGPKNNQTGKRDGKTSGNSLNLDPPGNPWNQPNSSSASVLFPDATSKVTKQENDAALEQALAESMKTYMEDLEGTMDPPPNDAAERFSYEPEVEYEWGKIQSNLPTTEPEKDSKISDRNNNSGTQLIKNLKIPVVKLERNIENCMVHIPKFIDKYGRIDGCNEKRMYMGKGARFKEQLYIEQLQQQQQQQLQNPNLIPEPQTLPCNSSDSCSDLSNASAQVPPKKNYTKHLPASAENQTETAMVGLGYSQDSSTNSQELRSQTVETEKNSEHSFRTVDQPLIKMKTIQNSSQNSATSTIVSEESSSRKFDPCAKEFVSVCSQNIPTLSQNTYLLPTPPFGIKPEASGDSSKAFPAQTLKKDTRDSSFQDSGIPEQTSTQTQDFGHTGRPIVSRPYSTNYQQKRHQSSGISVNRGGYHDGNYGDGDFNKANTFSEQFSKSSRPEQNYGRNPRKPQGESNNYRNLNYENNHQKYGHQNRHSNASQARFNPTKFGNPSRSDYQKEPKSDYNPQTFSREQKRDFQSENKFEQNSQQWETEQKRDSQTGPNVERSVPKKDEDYKRNLSRRTIAGELPSKSKPLSADTIPFEPAGQLNKNDNNKLTDSKIEKISPVSLPEVNINVVPKEKTDAWLKNVGTNDSEVPNINNFASRYSVPPPVQDVGTEMISIPSTVPPPTNIFSVSPTNSSSSSSTLNRPEVSNAAGLNENLPHSSSQAPPGFQSLERSTTSHCVCCTKYGNLQYTDPLLFRLLHQSPPANRNASIKFPSNPKNKNDNPETKTLSKNCPNCNCNSQLAQNINQGLTIPNVENCHVDKKDSAEFQMLHCSNPSPINTLSQNPVAGQDPETFQMGHVERTEWIPPNIQHANVALPGNLPFIPYCVDSAGNRWPVKYLLPNLYPVLGVQGANNVHPRGEVLQEFLPRFARHVSPDPERLMPEHMFAQQQHMFAQQHESASGYPPINNHGHQEGNMPMSLPLNDNNVDTSAIRGNNFFQSNPDETTRPFPLERRVGDKVNHHPGIPMMGQGRSRLRRSN